MNHTELVRAEQESARKAEKAARRARGLYEIFKNHPELINCQANEAAIDAQLGDDVSLENFDHDFNASAEFRSKLALQSLEQAAQRAEKTKRNLVNKIIDLMVVSPDSANAVAKQLFYLPIPELEHRLHEIEEKQRLALLPKEELKQIVKEHNQGVLQSKRRRFPPIPLDCQSREIRLMSATALKELIRIHGSDQVTARLQGTDHKEQERILREGISF